MPKSASPVHCSVLSFLVLLACARSPVALAPASPSGASSTAAPQTRTELAPPSADAPASASPKDSAPSGSTAAAPGPNELPADELAPDELKTGELETEGEASADEVDPESESDDAAIPAPSDVAAPASDAKHTKSGLSYKLLERGKQRGKPKPFDKVTVHYTGWTTNGKMFDSSLVRGAPAVFGVNQLIVGFTEGLQLMNTGDKTRLWIPEALAYKGRPGTPQGMLVFDVELLSIERMPEPPKAPSDVALPPKSAKKTASGLAYKVLKHGKGKLHPKANDVVTVHYTGWTTDGEMFDSSLTRGTPFTANLQHLIKGWSEGVQLLVVGDSARLWIPAELAYAGNPRAPQGTLVFDVTLLDTKPSQDAAPADKDVESESIEAEGDSSASP